MFGLESYSDLAGYNIILLPGQRGAIESIRFLRTFSDIYIESARREEAPFKEMSGLKSAYKEVFSVKHLTKTEAFPSFKRVYIWYDYSPHDCGVIIVPNSITEIFIRVSADRIMRSFLSKRELRWKSFERWTQLQGTKAMA